MLANFSAKKTFIALSYLLLIFLVAAVQGQTTGLLSKPKFSGKDQGREQIPISLRLIGSGFSQITEMQFVPGDSQKAFVLEKTGNLLFVTIQNNKIASRVIAKKFSVNSSSEMGLLGIAIPVDFARSGVVFVSYNPSGRKISRLSRFIFRKNVLINEIVLFELEQPYSNHNGGQIHLNSAGQLFFSLGDGGSGNDPHGYGQNQKALLGKILRFQVSNKNPGKLEAPKDNPFIGQPNIRPEIYVYGVRNPWKFQVLPDNRLIVADVGQNEFEEISIAGKGDNLGWNIFEASHCFRDNPNCLKIKTKKPLYEYDHSEGNSITGGYLLKSQGYYRKLANKYVFGDFVTGRIWALSLDEAKNKTEKVFALGQWPITISSFAHNQQNQLFVIDFNNGQIFLIEENN